MASWGDSASAEAQQQLDELLNVALGFAQEELAAHGEFFPYAAAIGGDGQPEMISAWPADGGDRPASDDVIQACLAALNSKREQLQAAAVVADVRTPDGDAIRVDLEHHEGHALTILLPYSRKRFSKNLDYGPIRAQAGQQQIWADA